MAKKKTVTRRSTKRLKDQKTVIVTKTVHPAGETWFPEKIGESKGVA